jgi:hypothetical protein
MKQGSLFVLYLGGPPNQDASDRALYVFGKLLTRGGVHWVGSMMFGLAVQKFLEGKIS